MLVEVILGWWNICLSWIGVGKEIWWLKCWLKKMDFGKIKVCLKGGGVIGRLGSYFECQMINNEVV